MGLACSQARLLTLTARKADCEYGLSIDAMHKMALTREMSELSSEYSSRLQSKQISYYANGKYNKINYGYLMGYGSNFLAVRDRDCYPLKSQNSMILTDYKGQVVMHDDYARAIQKVLGSSAMSSGGKGAAFSPDKIPAILSALTEYPEEIFQKVMDGDELSSEYTSSLINTMTLVDTGENTMTNNSDAVTKAIQDILDFYLPIFNAAASNGWTTEYNNAMAHNEDYLSDALVTGSLQLASVDDEGYYNVQDTLSYFITTGLVEERNDADAREEVVAWYEAEKERINEKETLLDLHIDELSTELEVIKTEMQSIQSLIDDAVGSVFDWGSG